MFSTKRTFCTTLFFVFLSLVTFAQTARLQLIHNSPTPTVDVYANGAKLLTNLVFRTATPFIDVPAGVDITLAVAPANSKTAAEAVFSAKVKFEAGKRYIAVAYGIVGSTTKPFNVAVTDIGKETATTAANVDVLFFHGSPDAPNVSILAGTSPVFTNIAYGTFSAAYASVPANATYPINITANATTTPVLASYELNLAYWAGKTAVVFATGLIDNKTTDSAFEPWVALSNGGTSPLKLVKGLAKPAPTTAKLQIIHNSPTPSVDIYVNGTALLKGFAFRTATPYIDVPSGVTLNIGVAAAGSTGVKDTIKNVTVKLDSGKNYIAVAYGVVGNRTTPFNIALSDAGRLTSTLPDNVDVQFFHGTPDAPAVDILAGTNVVFGNTSFGNFGKYISVPANVNYVIGVTPAGANTNVLGRYNLLLDFWKGQTAVVLATGFLSTTNPLAKFEPWVALSGGGTFPLPVRANLIPEKNTSALATSANSSLKGFSTYPNPAKGSLAVEFDLVSDSEVSLEIVDAAGKSVRFTYLGTLTKGLNQTVLNTENLNKGLYFINLKTATGSTTSKFVVE